MPDVDISIELARVERELEALEAARFEAIFARLQADRDEGAVVGDDDAIDAREAALLGGPEYQEALQRATAAGASGATLARATEPHARRLDQHRRRLLGALVRLDPAVAPLTRILRAEHAAFTPWINGAPGGRLDRLEALRHEPDRDSREAAWFGLTPLAEVAESSLVRLFEERNRAAALFGYDMYPDLAFDAEELSRIEFMATCDELEQQTRPIYQQFLAWCRRESGEGSLEPWDLEFLLTRLEEPRREWPRREQAARALRLLSEQGIDPGGVMIASAVETSPWSALAIPVRAPDDVRLLLNPRDGLVHLEAHLAGLGRAVRHRHLPETESTWRRDAPIVAEMSAGVAVRLGLRSVEAGATGERNVAWRRWRGVYRLRRAMAAALFELLAYEHVAGDLHGLWSEVHEQYLGFNRHPERLWSAAAHLASDPLRVARTLMGGLAADQIVAALDERHGGAPWPSAAAAEIRELLWIPGSRIPWEARFETLTGRMLDPEVSLRRLGADLGA